MEKSSVIVRRNGDVELRVSARVGAKPIGRISLRLNTGRWMGHDCENKLITSATRAGVAAEIEERYYAWCGRRASEIAASSRGGKRGKKA